MAATVIFSSRSCCFSFIVTFQFFCTPEEYEEKRNVGGENKNHIAVIVIQKSSETEWCDWQTWAGQHRSNNSPEIYQF
jgi:hypothetical protein